MECSKCKERLVCDKCCMSTSRATQFYLSRPYKAPECERCKKRYEKEIDEAKSELATLRQIVSKQTVAYEDRLVFLRLRLPHDANEVFKGDVALVIHGTKLIYAHCFILAGKPPVFCRMLECDMLEKKTGKIHINDASLPVMRAVIEYCYTADISFTDEVPPDEVFQVAHKYEINHLTNKCKDELCQRVNKKNVPKMLRLGKKFNARALQDAAVKYFKDHFDAVVPGVVENF